MTDHDDKVRVQWEKFQAELPELLTKYPGQWAVYLDRVRFLAADHDTALDWTLNHLDMDDGVVIAQVVEQKPIPAYKLGGFGAAAMYEKQYAELQAKVSR